MSSTLAQQLIVMGQPMALILDYLDEAENPSIEGFFEYSHTEESAYCSQVRWDTRSLQGAIAPSEQFTGQGFSGMMERIRRGS